ncbi:hypothetical protein BGX34_008699 [Mortierella sp. NVP85]|nr:hypothetical protein BGX34_008699 [Mortierella sp. NVP85]
MKITSILSVAVALCVLASDAAAALKPPRVDPCSDLAAKAKDATSELPFKAVKGCYEAQAFKKDIAEKTLASLESLVGNFYAFTDIARAPTHAPFQTPRVDLLGGLKKIRSKKWKTDYEFQMALYHLLASVNDGHLAYVSNCYRIARFVQPIVLYAPVVNGKQSVNVFYADSTKPGVPENIVDCKVITIDGVPALKAIQDYADNNSGVSRDPGVRLNDALAGVSWKQTWSITPGGFSRRWLVPKKDTVEYAVQCGKSKVQKIKAPWSITPITSVIKFNSFNDTQSYWDSQCLAPTRAKDPSGGNHRPDRGQDLAPVTEWMLERGTIKLPKGRKDSNGNDSPITKAKEVFTTSTTAFYTINNSEACVAVISTESVSSKTEYARFLEGVLKLRDAGCKKLIFDMTANGGGSIDFASYINALFFPDAKPYFSQDLRANAYVQGAAKVAINSPDVGKSIFDARGFFNSKTGQLFTDSSMYTKGKKYTRGGRTSTYTQRNFFGEGWSNLPLNDTLPWRANDMAIITNGYCGSACTMIATRFNLIHKVKTYVIGGIHKRAMSYFTFPGGFVYRNDYLVEDVQDLKYTAKGGPTYLPVNSVASIAMGELYATDKSTTPLEYDYKVHAAQVHLDNDAVLARNPDEVWIKIAKDFK